MLYQRPYLCKDFISCAATSADLEELPHFYPRTSLESLAMVLLELCIGEPLEKRPGRVGLMPADNTQLSHEYLLAIARTWHWEEIHAFDTMFPDVIESCMRFPDMQRVTQGRLDELRLEIYSVIVEPLCMEVDKRWGGRNWDHRVHV